MVSVILVHPAYSDTVEPSSTLFQESIISVEAPTVVRFEGQTPCHVIKHPRICTRQLSYDLNRYTSNEVSLGSFTSFISKCRI